MKIKIFKKIFTEKNSFQGICDDEIEISPAKINQSIITRSKNEKARKEKKIKSTKKHHQHHQDHQDHQDHHIASDRRDQQKYSSDPSPQLSEPSPERKGGGGRMSSLNFAEKSWQNHQFNVYNSQQSVAPGGSPKRGVRSKKSQGSPLWLRRGREILLRGEYCLFFVRFKFRGGPRPFGPNGPGATGNSQLTH